MAVGYKIRSGVPRPPVKKRAGGPDKYPFASMQIGQHFVVPKSEMEEGQTEKSFRDRIAQAARTYKHRVNGQAHLEPGYDEDTYTPVDFTVATLGEPPEDDPEAWQPGDVGVWRDS